jgi:hypothetical protein
MLCAITWCLSTTLFLGSVWGATIPNNDGFPEPNDQQKLAIGQQANGLLPNSPLPSSLGEGSTTAFQLIAFNELFETAYFSSILQNITDGVEGFQAENKDELIKVFTTVRAVCNRLHLSSPACLDS